MKGNLLTIGVCLVALGALSGYLFEQAADGTDQSAYLP